MLFCMYVHKRSKEIIIKKARKIIFGFPVKKCEKDNISFPDNSVKYKI